MATQPEPEAKLRARADQAAEEELEALAVEGLNSGQPLDADERYWAQKRRRLIDHHRKTGAR